MKKLTGLNNEIKMIGGQPYKGVDGSPITVGDVILDYINAYGFPQKPTIADFKQMGKIAEVGERIHKSADGIALEDAEFELLKEIVNPPVQMKVAMVVMQVMKVFENAETVTK